MNFVEELRWRGMVHGPWNGCNQNRKLQCYGLAIT